MSGKLKFLLSEQVAGLMNFSLDIYISCSLSENIIIMFVSQLHHDVVYMKYCSSQKYAPSVRTYFKIKVGRERLLKYFICLVHMPPPSVPHILQSAQS